MSTYPLLVTRFPGLMGDLYRARYTQGDSLLEDRLELLEPVSDYPGVSEHAPRWSADRAFFLMEDLLVEESPRRVWAREDIDDYVCGPEGIYFCSEGELFALKKPGGRAQRIEVPAPLTGAIEPGLLLGTERGLLQLDPETGEGVELARGVVGDFSLSGRLVAYTDGSALRTRHLDTGEDRLIVPGDDRWRFSPRLSPDGTRIFYGEARLDTLQTRLQVVESQPGAAPRTLLDDAIEAVPPG